MEFSNVDTYQVTLSGVTAVDANGRGGCAVVVKNMNAAGGNVMYVGPATNEAGSALSSTTGYPLQGGESLSIDLTIGREDLGRQFSVVGTNADKLAVIVVKP